MMRATAIVAILFAIYATGCASSSIYEAAAAGHDLAVSNFIANGTDPNQATSEGATPLLVAVLSGRLSTVKLLLARGADAERPNKKGVTPLAYAVSKNSPEIVETLLSGGAKVDTKFGVQRATPLMLAVQNGNAAMIELLLRHGASLATKNAAGDTPLLLALRMQRLDLIQLLLRRGAAPDEPDATGQTPLQLATYTNRSDLAAALIGFGAKPIGVQGRVGMGVAVGKDGAASVSMIAPDSPAANAGIQVGDRLLTVDGQPIGSLTLAQIAARLRGPAQSPVTVGLQRESEAPQVYTLVRQAVGVQTTASTGAPGSSPAAPAIAHDSDIDFPTDGGAKRPDDFALIVGIEEYQSLPKAQYGVRDAETARRHFAALGIPQRNIVALEGNAATGNKLKSYLQEWLPLNVNERSTLWVYYSGHGAPDARSGDAFLVPWDGDPKFLKSTAYPLKQFYADLMKTKAKRVVVALDSCFSGAGGRSVLAEGTRPLVVKVEDGAPRNGRLTVLAAASGDETTGTLDDQAHGAFTYFFFKGLSGAAKNTDGAVTSKSLYDYLKPRVQDEAHRQNREQTPTLIGGSDADPL
jgi:hypothetical protein